QPTHPSPSEGTRVRRGLHPAAAGEGTALEAGAHAPCDRRGAPPALRTQGSLEARAVADMVGEAIALPVRARRLGRRRRTGREARLDAGRRAAARVAARALEG